MADMSPALNALTQSAQDSITLMQAQTQAQAQMMQASVQNQSERMVIETANGVVAGLRTLAQSIVQNISR